MKSERGMHHFSARPTCQPSVPHELNPRCSLLSTFAHFAVTTKKAQNRFCKLFCAFFENFFSRKEILLRPHSLAKPRHMPGPALMSPSPQASLPAHPLAPMHTHTFLIPPADSRACLCVEPLLCTRDDMPTQNSTKIHSLCCWQVHQCP
jgi:hypothetical protein